MLLHDSRRDARMDKHGKLVTLEEQDRSLWDPERIREGVALLHRALRMRQAGTYQLQAAISAIHAQAASPAETRCSGRSYATIGLPSASDRSAFVP